MDRKRTTPFVPRAALRGSAVGLLLCVLALACAHSPPDPEGQDSAAKSGGWYPQRHPEAAFQEIDDEEGGLVVLPSKSEVQVLNPVGIRVYSLIDGTRTPEDVARAVFDEFEVDYETALVDVYAFLCELEEAGMLADPIPDHIKKEAGLEALPAKTEAPAPSN